MAEVDAFDAIAKERHGLADLFDQLTSEQLAQPSLCGAWTVHDVAAHLVVPLEARTVEFLLTMLTSRGNFDRANLKMTARRAARSIQELTALLRSRAESRFTPPGMGPEAPLTDLLVHGLDVRRPLGISRTIPTERMRTCLDFLTARPRTGFVPAGRLTGLRLEATDLDWSAGSGLAVQGTAEELLLAATGRPAEARQLRGAGADTLRDRLQPCGVADPKVGWRPAHRLGPSLHNEKELPTGAGPGDAGHPRSRRLSRSRRSHRTDRR